MTNRYDSIIDHAIRLTVRKAVPVGHPDNLVVSDTTKELVLCLLTGEEIIGIQSSLRYYYDLASGALLASAVASEERSQAHRQLFAVEQIDRWFREALRNLPGQHSLRFNEQAIHSPHAISPT